MSVPRNSIREESAVGKLKDPFVAKYGEEPEFYVRVPGRVNLIGEHIDYCGYGVCPMALEQDIKLAVSTSNDGILELANMDESYKAYRCNLKGLKITLQGGAPEWYQYFLCGVRGILDILPESQGLKGLKVLVCGTIPPSAGLSSSSALVSAAALAMSFAHKLSLSKEEIASICAKCERYIGTQGGGMDQAIAFLASKGCAKMIDFNPLRSEDVVLPSGAVFVIAHSLTGLNKAATADFNCRVIECRLAAQLIAKAKGLDWKNIKKLKDLQTELDVDLDSMIALVKQLLHEEPYTKVEVLQTLETNEEELLKTSLTENTKDIQSFKVYQRGLHVFQEALRVKQFFEASKAPPSEDTLLTLGRLMSQSHNSLRDLYECSHPQLEKLVDLSKDLTLGCRLTGAGWGGCIVALLTPQNVDPYIAMVTEKFYMPLGVNGGYEKLIFATSPNCGACVYE